MVSSVSIAATPELRPMKNAGRAWFSKANERPHLRPKRSVRQGRRRISRRVSFRQNPRRACTAATHRRPRVRRRHRELQPWIEPSAALSATASLAPLFVDEPRLDDFGVGELVRGFNDCHAGDEQRSGGELARLFVYKAKKKTGESEVSTCEVNSWPSKSLASSAAIHHDGGPLARDSMMSSRLS